MARRTFVNLRDEHILRAGRVGDSAYSTRAQEFLNAAYFQLATEFLHPELCATDTSQTATLYVNTIALPADCHVVVAAVLLQLIPVQGLKPPLVSLALSEARYQFAAYTAVIGRPKEATRFGSTLYCDKRFDDTYPIVIYYLQKPAEPTYAGASSALAVQWDEAVLNRSLAVGLEALWRPDLAAVYEARLDKFLAGVPNPRLVEQPAHGMPDSLTRGRSLGGALG